jgi:nucleoside-diphosphate-sugar epimerase
VDDVAEAYLLALEKAPPASIFNIANENSLRADAIAEVGPVKLLRSPAWNQTPCV